jgi:hypothetical protein
MEPSPLTQVSRPDVFQPKIIQLYETLFKVCMRYCRHTVKHTTDAAARRTRMRTSTCPKASGKSSSCTGPTHQG